MNIRGIVAGVVVGLVIGGGTLGASQAADNPTPPDLTCETVADCQAVIDAIYSDAKSLGAETLDLRKITAKQDRKIQRLTDRVERLRDRLND